MSSTVRVSPSTSGARDMAALSRSTSRPRLSGRLATASRLHASSCCLLGTVAASLVYVVDGATLGVVARGSERQRSSGSGPRTGVSRRRGCTGSTLGSDPRASGRCCSSCASPSARGASMRSCSASSSGWRRGRRSRCCLSSYPRSRGWPGDARRRTSWRGSPYRVSCSGRCRRSSSTCGTVCGSTGTCPAAARIRRICTAS